LPGSASRITRRSVISAARISGRSSMRGRIIQPAGRVTTENRVGSSSHALPERTGTAWSSGGVLSGHASPQFPAAPGPLGQRDSSRHVVHAGQTRRSVLEFPSRESDTTEQAENHQPSVARSGTPTPTG
jgi:hypothetical protein